MMRSQLLNKMRLTKLSALRERAPVTLAAQQNAIATHQKQNSFSEAPPCSPTPRPHK